MIVLETDELYQDQYTIVLSANGQARFNYGAFIVYYYFYRDNIIIEELLQPTSSSWPIAYSPVSGNR